MTRETFWGFNQYSDLFCLCPPVRYAPPVTEHMFLHMNLYVRIWHVRLEGANVMLTLSWGSQGENISIFYPVPQSFISLTRIPNRAIPIGSNIGFQFCTD